MQLSEHADDTDFLTPIRQKYYRSAIVRAQKDPYCCVERMSVEARKSRGTAEIFVTRAFIQAVFEEFANDHTIPPLNDWTKLTNIQSRRDDLTRR